MRAEVEKALDTIRPMLQADGGNIKLVDVDEKTGVVRVTLQGACGCCPAATMTLKMLVEKKLKEAVPAVTQVIPA